MSARTILNPPLINELSGLFDGTSSPDVLSLTASSNITCNALVASEAISAGTTISATGNISTEGAITAGGAITASGAITSSGTMTAQIFAGGIAMVIGTLAFPELAPDGAGTPTDIEIANFVGSGTSAYVISNNSQGLIHLTIEYVSNTATTTTVAITAYNLATVEFSGDVNYSIIAMN
jgi:hypothetical protein